MGMSSHPAPHPDTGSLGDKKYPPFVLNSGQFLAVFQLYFRLCG